MPADMLVQALEAGVVQAGITSAEVVAGDLWELPPEKSKPVVDLEKCTRCGLCEKSCVYGAIEVIKKENLFEIDDKICQSCGMCISVCPYHALSME